MDTGGWRSRDERGFTLIELMVVVLIIAVLLMVAIPAFLGARRRADERVAQSVLRHALTAARSASLDGGDYSSVSVSDIAGDEPSIRVKASNVPAIDSPDVSIKSSADGYTFWAAATDSRGACFYVRDVFFGDNAGTAYAFVDQDCESTADAAEAVPDGSWKRSWRETGT